MTPLLAVLINGAKRHHVAMLCVMALGSIVLGGALISLTQGVPIGTGLYWSLVTAATVGYGDVIPHNAVGRLVAAGVIVTAIPLVAGVFALGSAFAAATQIRRVFKVDHSLPARLHSGR